MLIDFHTHAFPDKIAERAVKKLSFASGGLRPYTDGTVKELKTLMKAEGVEKSVVLNIATNAHQMKSVNDFAREINGGDIISFGSVFPDSEDVFSELERIKAMGLKGVKLHPDYQGFFVDDEKMKPIYKKISKLGLITVFHAGVDYGFAPPYHATPERLKRALKWFDYPVVAAHFGGLGLSEDVLSHLVGNELLYIDTSFSYGAIPKHYAKEIIEKHTADKILFGTDCPWQTPKMVMTLLETLELTAEEMEKITHKNAENLLGI